jgi:hypothetical protein
MGLHRAKSPGPIRFPLDVQGPLGTLRITAKSSKLTKRGDRIVTDADTGKRYIKRHPELVFRPLDDDVVIQGDVSDEDDEEGA